MPSSTTVSAREFPRLLFAARRGNRVAQDQLFTRYRPQIERIAHAELRRRSGGRGTALAARFSTADIVQDVMCTLLARLAAFQGTSEGEFIQYVKAIVKSRALDAIRFHHSSPRDLRRHLSALRTFDPALLAELPCPSAPMNDPARTTELEDHYRAALATLPRSEQDVLRARIERGLCFTELAAELGYPSRYAARRAFFAAQSRLSLRLRAAAPAQARAN